MRYIQGLIIALLLLGPLAVGQAAAPKDSFEIGTEISYFEYEEPNFMEEDGVLAGIFGTYTRTIHENQPHQGFGDLFRGGNGFNSFTVDARFLYGKVDYTSTNTGSLDSIDDFLFEIRGLTGYDFPLSNDRLITLFLGLGYRYLNDDSSGDLTTTGAAGYERESNYLYLPVGVRFFTPVDEAWSVTASVEYDWFLTGQQDSHLEDAIAGLNTIENDQKDGWGVRGSVKIKREGERFDFFVEPYVRYWKVDDSEVSPITYMGVAVGFGLEPENNSMETGARIGLSF